MAHTINTWDIVYTDIFYGDHIMQFARILILHDEVLTCIETC